MLTLWLMLRTEANWHRHFLWDLPKNQSQHHNWRSTIHISNLHISTQRTCFTHMMQHRLMGIFIPRSANGIHFQSQHSPNRPSAIICTSNRCIHWIHAFFLCLNKVFFCRGCFSSFSMSSKCDLQCVVAQPKSAYTSKSNFFTIELADTVGAAVIHGIGFALDQFPLGVIRVRLTCVRIVFKKIFHNTNFHEFSADGIDHKWEQSIWPIKNSVTASSRSVESSERSLLVNSLAVFVDEYFH